MLYFAENHGVYSEQLFDPRYAIGDGLQRFTMADNSGVLRNTPATPARCTANNSEIGCGWAPSPPGTNWTRLIFDSSDNSSKLLLLLY